MLKKILQEETPTIAEVFFQSSEHTHEWQYKEVSGNLTIRYCICGDSYALLVYIPDTGDDLHFRWRKIIEETIKD